MNKKIEEIFDSIKNINKANPKPYFYTRLSSKLDDRSKKEIYYLKYERPFLVLSVILLLMVNIFFINSEEEENNIKITAEEIYFDERDTDIINFSNYEE